MTALPTSVRWSHLKHMAESPAHYYHAATQPSADTPALRAGRLIDVALLGGDDLCVYEGQRRGNSWEDFRLLNMGREIYTRAEVDAVQPVVDAVRRHPEAMRLLEAGWQKERFTWEWLGRECNGEPDVAGAVLVDLKSTRCAKPGRFDRDARWYGYHAQLAWYRNGLRLSGRGDPERVVIVAVEKRAPYPVVLYRVTERALDLGLRQCRAWMEQLAACGAANSWPSYCESEVDLDVEDDVELTFGVEDDDDGA